MRTKLIVLMILVILGGLSFHLKAERKMEKKNFYIEYCGHKFHDVRQLVSGTCSRHPDGSNKGCHKLYECSEKNKYTCKYCGKQFPSIMTMVGGTCPYHPKGNNKGKSCTSTVNFHELHRFLKQVQCNFTERDTSFKIFIFAINQRLFI